MAVLRRSTVPDQAFFASIVEGGLGPRNFCPLAAAEWGWWAFEGSGVEDTPLGSAASRGERSRMEIVVRHFAAENAHDVAATLATYTDDIVWDDDSHTAPL